MDERIIRRRLIFRGEVQGVGFRYTASHSARDIGLTGFVRNEPDGSVLIEAQGTEEQIDMLIISLQNDLYIDIQDMACQSLKPVPEQYEQGFGILY